MAITKSVTREKSEQTAVFHRILVATDYSEASRRAFSEALTIAASSHAHLSVIYIAFSDWRYEMLESPQIELEQSDEERRLRAFIAGFSFEHGGRQVQGGPDRDGREPCGFLNGCRSQPLDCRA